MSDLEEVQVEPPAGEVPAQAQAVNATTIQGSPAPGGPGDTPSPAPVGDLLLILLGLGSGAGLLLYGVLVSLNAELSSLIICVGLGIILATLGTRATVKYRGWTITGGGAVAVVLFLLIGPGAPFHRGFIKITGGLDDNSYILVSDDTQLHGRLIWHPSHVEYEFIIFGNELTRPTLTVEIDQDLIEIDAEYINDNMKNGNVMDLRYDIGRTGQIVDHKGEVVSLYSYHRTIVRPEWPSHR